jgi:nucleotide-binding universal stress UspA family protein
MTIDVRSILVPIDFSPNARTVLEWAAHLAEEHECPLVLLHAYHLPVDFQQLEGAYLPADFWTQVKNDAARTWRSTPRPLRDARTAGRDGACGRATRPA